MNNPSVPEERYEVHYRKLTFPPTDKVTKALGTFTKDAAQELVRNLWRAGYTAYSQPANQLVRLGTQRVLSANPSGQAAQNFGQTL